MDKKLTHKSLKKEALKKFEVLKEYEAVAGEFVLSAGLIRTRKISGK